MQKALRFAAVLVLLGLAAPAFAGKLPVVRHVCANGLEVFVAENHALPLVTVEYAARNGSMTEPPEYNGLSHLYEHMFFKANAKLPSQEAFLARVRELGMDFNGTTGTERVNYYFTTTSDHFTDAMVFMRDAVTSPLFDAKELERERVVVTGEIDRNEANPYYHLGHALSQRVWWKYPSRKDPLGRRETVLAATPEMMRTIAHRYYVPNNSALVVTGNVTPEEVFKLADTIYAAWPRGEDPFVKFPLVEHPALPQSSVVLVQQPVETFSGEVTWLGPSTVGASVDATYAADLLSAAIGERSSKFQKALVESGLCVNAGLSWSTQKNVGPITLGFEAAPDKVDACVRAAFAELPKMKAPDYLSDEELHNAAHRLAVDQAETRESSSGLAHDVTFWWASAGLEYYADYLDHVSHVTRADIARYLDGFVLGKPFVFAAMTAPAQVKAGLDEAHLAALAGITAPVHVEPPAAARPAPKSTKKKGGK
jgi:zinc protease